MWGEAGGLWLSRMEGELGGAGKGEFIFLIDEVRSRGGAGGGFGPVMGGIRSALFLS